MSQYREALKNKFINRALFSINVLPERFREYIINKKEFKNVYIFEFLFSFLKHVYFILLSAGNQE